MRIKDQKKWDEYVEVNNTDAYSNAVIVYAKTWADLMEAHLDKGEKLEDCAQDTSHEADTDGITGFMYGAAVQVLYDCWEHGEQLRVWHNNKYTKISTKGVVNPAIITIADDGLRH